jgi:AcrR family transcriptional regulator
MNKNVLDQDMPAVASRVKRQRILDAIAASCAEKTFASTTIADIVSRAGVSRATFYKHFPNKRSCFDAAVEWFVDELRAVCRAAHSDAADGPENVRRAIAAALVLMTAAPDYTRLMVIEAIAVDPGLINRFRTLLIAALRVASDNADDTLPSKGTIRTAYGQAQVLVANQILVGRGDELQELLPDIVYIALFPFAGPEEALKQAQLAR